MVDHAPGQCFNHAADPCEVCQTFLRCHVEIHVADILSEAKERLAQIPIVKSMHPDTRRLLFDAVMGLPKHSVQRVAPPSDGRPPHGPQA